MSMHTLQARIQALGGNQLGRMEKQKLNSLKWALKNDYNSRLIETPYRGAWQALIVQDTANNMKSDYDKKFISIEKDAGLEIGDTFRILDNDTHWMVYLPVLTETAYFRAQIIRCRYEININGHNYWIYFQGPTETDIRWFQKSSVELNEPNLSGTIYIKDDDNTRDFFHRFTHIMIDNQTWEVQVIDKVTVDGILELEVQEYYNNTVQQLPRIINEADEDSFIHGPVTVKQDTVVGYSVTPEHYNPDIEWKIINNPRVKLLGTYEDGSMCKVRIYDGAIKYFFVQYGEQQLKVNVDWKKPVINGPQVVYPYDTHTYWLKGIDDNTEISFKLNCGENIAKFIDIGNDYCKVEITSPLKTSFTLLAKNGDDIYELPITIGSLSGIQTEAPQAEVKQINETHSK